MFYERGIQKNLAKYSIRHIWFKRFSAQGYCWERTSPEEVLHGTTKYWYLIHPYNFLHFTHMIKADSTPGGGGYLTKFWTGGAIEVSKTHPFLIPNFPKCIPDFIPIFQKYIPDFIPIFWKCIPDLIPITKIVQIDTVPYTNRENRYRSLYQNRENRYPSRWHVPVPKICIVPPPRGFNRCMKWEVAMSKVSEVSQLDWHFPQLLCFVFAQAFQNQDFVVFKHGAC